MTDFQKFFIGILSGLLIAAIIIGSVFLFTTRKTDAPYETDMEMTARLQAEKEELARLEAKRSQIEAEIEALRKKPAERELTQLEKERLRQSEEANKSLNQSSADANKKKLEEQERRKKADEALRRAKKHVKDRKSL